MAQIPIVLFAVLILSVASSTSAMAIELAQAEPSTRPSVPRADGGTAGAGGVESTRRQRPIMESSTKPNVPQADVGNQNAVTKELKPKAKAPVIKKKKVAKKKKPSRKPNVPRS